MKKLLLQSQPMAWILALSMLIVSVCVLFGISTFIEPKQHTNAGIYEILGPYEYTRQNVTQQVLLLRGEGGIIQKSLAEIPPTIMTSYEYVLLTEDGLVLPLSPASIDYSLD